VKQGESIGEKHALEIPNKDSVYMFSYTSGTTGDPKAVISEHRNYIASAAAGLALIEGISE
jgi:long-subunit acyl-CoA synthetase (AMP-forming)